MYILKKGGIREIILVSTLFIDLHHPASANLSNKTPSVPNFLEVDILSVCSFLFHSAFCKTGETR